MQANVENQDIMRMRSPVKRLSIAGVVMALASCHFGLKTTGGAPGVGRAVNSTVVASAAGIFVLDYFISFILG